LRYQKRGVDRSSAPKTLSFGEKIAKIGPANPEIICLQEITKDEKRKKLMQAKYIARGLPSGLNDISTSISANADGPRDAV